MARGKHRRRDLGKARAWQERIAAWKRSGLRQSDFCRRRRIGYQQFLWWRKRLAERPLEERSAPAHLSSFVPVQLSGLQETEQSWACEISAPSGLQVRLREHPGPEQIGRWLGMPERGTSCG